MYSLLVGLIVLAAVLMVLSSLATVLTKSIVRAATYLFFVLLGTAGMYFLMGYTFLGAAQVIVYAGGIIVLYVFSILLTEGAKDQEIFKRKIKDASWGFVLSFVGFLAFVGVVLTHNFKAAVLAAPSETANAVTTIDSIGRNMLSSGDNGYLLPFEAVSVLLLACIVGALMIARKR
mgnify:CR=1 FL=1